MLNKISSLVISIYCLIAVLSIEGVSGLFIMVVLVPLLACIWFGELMGSITGFGGLRHPVVDKQSPGCLVSGIAWLVLLVLAGALTKRIF